VSLVGNKDATGHNCRINKKDPKGREKKGTAEKIVKKKDRADMNGARQEHRGSRFAKDGQRQMERPPSEGERPSAPCREKKR